VHALMALPADLFSARHADIGWVSSMSWWALDDKHVSVVLRSLFYRSPKRWMMSRPFPEIIGAPGECIPSAGVAGAGLDRARIIESGARPISILQRAWQRGEPRSVAHWAAPGRQIS